MTRKKSQRGRRVDEVVRQVIGDSLLALGDPRLREVTVTGADVARDSAVADVFVQLHGNPHRRAHAMEALERVRPALQTRINDELRLRRTPILRFREDFSADEAARIEALLAEHVPPRDPPAEEAG